MRITVIGGSGATGSAVVAEAARRGHTVTSVTRSGMHAEGATADVVADLADTPAVVDLVDDPAFPEDYRNEALAFADVLELFRSAGDAVAWTLVSPAPNYPTEESSGAYVSGTDSPAGPALSAADMALALVDEAERDTHRGIRFTVASA